MRCTIIADASFCPDTKAAGYAYWIASDRGKLGGSGAMRDVVVNNIAAEMMALLNGMHQACINGLVQPHDDVLLQTDCLGAIEAFEDRRKSMTDEERGLVVYYKSLKSKANVAVQFRHVKGHTSGNTPRLWINNKCDELAKAAMRNARRAILKGRTK